MKLNIYIFSLERMLIGDFFVCQIREGTTE